MFIAEVIIPESRKRRITCSSCGISYSPRDYQLLYESKKIIYFKHKNKIICHECLYKKIKSEANGKKMKFKIINRDHDFICVFEPDNNSDVGDTAFDDLF